MKKLFFTDFQKTINPHVKFLEEPRREIIIKNFMKYLRERGKIVIELDSVIREPSYNQLFLKIYITELFTNPHKFVAYQSGIGFYSENTELKSYMLRDKKFFPTYFHLLFSKLENCSFCWRKDIKVICMYCRTCICCECFYEWTSTFFVYNNQFRCRACRELNWWSD